MGDVPSKPGSFEQRWGELSLDSTLQVPGAQTITARTLAQWRQGSAQETVPGTPGARPPAAEPAEPRPGPESPLPRVPIPKPTSRQTQPYGQQATRLGTATLPRISMRVEPQGGDDAAPEALQSRSDIVVGRILGEGGMGRVYLARQNSLRRDVAIKTLKEDASASSRESLVMEARVSGGLEHPGIIPVHALGVVDDGRPVLVMKRIEGVTWMELLQDASHPGWDPWDERTGDRLLANLEILSQVCEATEFAHSRGIIHRDIKPQNVLLGRFGEVYLVDWGIATETANQEDPPPLVGTPAYMAPEMVAGDPVDPRTDVFLLGAVLHEVLTRSPRHQGATLRMVLQAAWEPEPLNYGGMVPRELGELCNRATRRNREERPQSARVFRRALSDYVQHRSSVGLAEAAAKRLAELEQLVHQQEHEDPGWTLRAQELATEARFGFERALEGWAENGAAQRGLTRSLRATARLEIHRENPEAARAAAAKLGGPDPDLDAEIRALEDRLEQKRERDEKLAALESDLDKKVGQRQRLFGLAILGIASVGVTVFALLQQMSGVSADHQDITLIPVMLLPATWGTIYVMRAELLRNRFNRQVVVYIEAALVAILLNRSLGWVADVPIGAVFAMDALLVAALSGFATFTLLRWFAWIAGIMATTAVAITLLPDSAEVLFNVGVISSMGLGVLFWRRTE